ncbi:DNA topoisomerase IV subunit B [Mycoplasma sp. (ex Biomphalaria glabrata)]|uniref:DNA topoisomerase (ATP-hydrolyzing) subunit B n=1 Tax=Mycoplasma sp. (ex Biomphalaria glabrata) TaxID=1749074 RepID=UPI00073A5CFE|nr:DNA topoisomerase (ATP-hydrolyzing) subunit B [Mycoplasma sp. (ex Biomphalaria glabrata)]ALV23339.1 DNA topoisomerase IV subunit B [Mycoplasma sp. (ex Biomphalaria glabrata)]
MEYTSSSIKILEGLEAVRKRPGMYIGNTNEKGYHHLVWEILDNSIDEALAGFCNEINITVTKNNEIIIEDNGRGIPVDIHPKTNMSTVETVFCNLHAGGKFDNSTYKVSGGLHGVGASVVNALSEYLIVKVFRNGNTYEISFNNGGKKDQELKIIGSSSKTGTWVKFKPDQTIFKEVNTFNHQTLVDRIKQLAFLNKGLRLKFSDKRNETDYTFFYQGGIQEYLQELNKNKEKNYNEIFYFDDTVNDINVELALQHVDTEDYVVASFCNNISTHEGGTHEEGFKMAFTRVINNYLTTNFKKSKDKINLQGEDIREGLTCLISIKHPEPQYEGQTKGKLSNSDARKAVNDLFDVNFEKFLLENPEVANKIIEKGLEAQRARIAAKKAREFVKRKGVLEISTLPGKLADCSSRNPKECELFLVEGDSAGGSAKLGRNREIQAILPLKGKVINVEKNLIQKIMNNQEIGNLIKSIGCGIQESFDIAGLKYHKIIIMTDADVDGSHIRTLLLTFFFRYMKPLVENGYVYLAQPPLYKLENKKQILYFYNDNELNKYREENDTKGFSIQRYKGLGEMNPQQLWETTMNPELRQLIKITIDDVVLADETFSMLMGSDVEPRRKFIKENAKFIKNLDV